MRLRRIADLRVMPFDLLAILVLFGAVAEASPTSTWAEYRPDGLSSVRLQGDVLDVRRKLFEWEVRGEPIEGCFRIANDLVRDPKAVEGKAEIKVNTLRGFKDGVAMGTNMDAIVRHKLRADLHPTIAFTLRSLDLVVIPVNPPLRVRCVAQGDLVIAGVTNAVTIPLRMQFEEGDRLTVSGEFNLAMSDFSIERPGGGMHTLIAADRVWISFEWRLLRVHSSSALWPLKKGLNHSRHLRPSSALRECAESRPGLAAFHRSANASVA